jgi:hypothetical protein
MRKEAAIPNEKPASVKLDQPQGLRRRSGWPFLRRFQRANEVIE